MKISLCMIVKNEEKVLRNCLESLKGLVDEMIIVDTGSTDKTKEIAREYTPYVYDYEWNQNFAAARNFAFSKATGDYIYSADADEIIDEENQLKFKAMKKVLLPEIEIVQMIYVTEQANHPTENFTRDYRPKLFKRLREFTWIDPIHETINTNPVVYNSDIEIIHRPQGSHSSRDFKVFEKLLEEQGKLSDRLLTMYTRELYKAGTEADFIHGRYYLESMLENLPQEKELLKRQVIAVLMKLYRQIDDAPALLKMALRPEVNLPSAEVCMELGYFFLKVEDYEEAINWFHSAAFVTESELDIASSGTSALFALALSYRKKAKSPRLKALPKEEYDLEYMRLMEKATEFEQMAKEWKPQELDLNH